MKDKKKILNTALINFDRIQEAMLEEREQCLEDRRFYSIVGAQWEGALKSQFENKPMFEMNKIHLSIIKIINEYRNNRITVDFISKDGTPNNDLADICDGLFRADEQDSGAKEAYDNAFEEAVGGGFGALRLVTCYEDEEDDENEKQRIRIEPIYDADSSVFFDLDAKRQDKADAKYCYVMYSMTPEAYENEYEGSPTSLNKDISFIEYDWFSPDTVFIAEYYVVEEKKETVRIFQNIVGEEVKYSEADFEDNPELENELEVTGTKELRQKKVTRKKVHKYIISGSEILEDCGFIAGKNIPIIPNYGKRWFVDSVERCMGHVRLVKDSQRLKNMLMSQLAEIASRSTTEKPIFTPEQVAGHEDTWAEDNIVPMPYMVVNPITDAAGASMPSGPIAYTKVSQIPPALAALLQLVDIDMKELLGNSGEGEKMLSHVSGKAHELIEKRIDGQAFIYTDNFSKTIQRTGEVWLSMAKEIYVEEGRKMKSIDQTGQMSSVELLTPGMSETEGVTKKNDITKATFDVAVDVGPSSASQREATVSSIISMLAITQDPETAQVLQATAIMNMEGDGISETRSYFRKKLLRMGAIEPTEEEAEELAAEEEGKEPTSEEKALEGMAAESQAKAVKTQAEVGKVQSEIQLNQAKTAETYSDVDINQRNLVVNALEREEQLKQAAEQADMLRQQQQQALMGQPQQDPNMQQ